MSDFDPYHKWLGIPPAEQPPNHYRLLGVALFESDGDVIDAAADRQMSYVSHCATGPYTQHSQSLLNELSAARLCLLTPSKKGAYDAELKVKLGASAAAAATKASAPEPVKAKPPAPPVEDDPFDNLADLPPAELQRGSSRRVSRESPPREAPVTHSTRSAAGRKSRSTSGSSGDGANTRTLLIVAGAAAILLTAAIWGIDHMFNGPSSKPAVAIVEGAAESPIADTPIADTPIADTPVAAPPVAATVAATVAAATPSADPAPELAAVAAPVPPQAAPSKSGRSQRVKPPPPIALWEFEDGLQDSVGGMHGTAQGAATVSDGRLQLDGETAYVVTEPIAVDLTAKTLEVWVALKNTSQRGGGAITLETADGKVFDSIVFGERERGCWGAGSDSLRRSDAFRGRKEPEPGADLVQIAIVYDADGTITGYRNGQPYGRAYRRPGPAKFAAGTARVTIGLRHSPANSSKLLQGSIGRALLYDRALSPQEIAGAADAMNPAGSEEPEQPADESMASPAVVAAAEEPEPEEEVPGSGGLFRGLVGEYFAGTDFAGAAAAVRIDKSLNFEWGAKSPLAGVPVDKFSVRWRGYLAAPQPGEVQLVVYCNDGVRLTLDGKRIVDDFAPHSTTQRHAAKLMLDQRAREFMLEFVEGTADAECRVCWSLAGEAEEPVPPTAFMHLKTQVPVRSSAPTTTTAVTTPAAAAPPQAATDSEPGTGAGEKIDLLSKIDPARDSVRGTWRLEGGVLLSPGDPAVLQLPVRALREYIITAEVESATANGLMIGLFTAGKQPAIVLDGWRGRHSGLEQLDGMSPNSPKNPTRYDQRAVRPGEKTTIICRVGQNAIALSCNDRPIVNWTGNFSRLKSDPFWQVPDKQALYLATDGSEYRITKLEVVIPAGGPAKGTNPRGTRAKPRK